MTECCSREDKKYRNKTTFRLNRLEEAAEALSQQLIASEKFKAEKNMQKIIDEIKTIRKILSQ